jgi:hypothetical protein
VSGQLHAPVALPQEKSAPVPIGQEAGGPQSWPRRRGDEKELAPAGIQTPAVQAVVLQTELSRLLCNILVQANFITASCEFLPKCLMKILIKFSNSASLTAKYYPEISEIVRC